MRTEVAVLKRCCCCLPLRRGLLAWGYLKLMITAFFLIFVIATLITIRSMYTGDYILIVVMIFLALDVIANIIFIIGSHTKSLKLLKSYYFYSIFFLALTSLATILYTIVVFYVQWDNISIRFLFLLGSDTAFLLLILLLQTYILILQRSQIVKMSDAPSSFRFVNNAAEAESCLATEYPHPQEQQDITTEYRLNGLTENKKITVNKNDIIVQN